jgi:serine/threonine protein phosphatase 1
MLKSLRQLFERQEPAPPAPEVPAGQRVYAVGDIHGRLDLFEAMIAAIEQFANGLQHGCPKRWPSSRAAQA